MTLGNFFFSSSGAAAYKIENSLRFRGSQYLNRPVLTQAPTNGYLGTTSQWVKLDTQKNGGDAIILAASRSGVAYSLYHERNTPTYKFVQLGVFGGTNPSRRGDALYRDYSAWHHILTQYDCRVGTNVNTGFRIWVNGEEVTQASSAGGWSVENNWAVTEQPTPTCQYGRNGSAYFSGYLAECHVVDGTLYGPGTFGEYDDNGVWVPKEVSGVSYGNNGWYLDFSDPANIGADRSGNGINFTPVNFELTNTSSFNYDWTTDSPTTNYAVLNPIFRGASNPDTREANLMFNSGGSWTGTMATVGPIEPGTGTYYWEVYGNSDTYCAIADATNASALRNLTNPGATAGFASFRANGNNAYVDTTTYSGVPTWNNQWTSFTLDTNNNTLKMERSGGTYTLNYGSGSMANDPLLVVTAAFSSQARVNYGQRPLQRTQTAGSKLLAATELPDVAITNPSEHFNVVTYTGTGNPVAVSGVGFSPDLVWVKARSRTADHKLQDSVRGSFRYLQTNLTNAENTNSGNDWFRSFDADGFTVAQLTTGGTSTSEWAGNGDTYVAWCWNAGSGSPVSNTAGTITSTVKANQTAGFSIVTYSGNSTNNSTIGHGLGAAPSLIITKVRTGASNEGWPVWHETFGNTQYLQLNQTSAVSTDSNIYGGSNNTAPTSTVYSVGAGGVTNTSGRTYVAYCWSEIPGFSSFGSYAGTSSTDGVFVYTGFRPAFVMVKNTQGGSWFLHDTARMPYNPAQNELLANTPGPEGSSYPLDILSNGFKWRSASGEVNTGPFYIYVAFAEHPFGGGNVSPATAR